MSDPEADALSEGISIVAHLAVKHGFVTPDQMKGMLEASGKVDSGRLGQRLVSGGHMKSLELETLFEIAACEKIGDAEGAAEATARLAELRKEAAPAAPEAAPIDPEIALAQSDPKRRFGKYVMLNELGRGGMGIVYRAWQADLRRIVALKVLPSELADAEERARFEREARVAAQLNHSNIVHVHECGQIDGKPYFTMDYIQGKPLSALIKEGGLNSRKALEIGAQAAMALQFAHEHGVVHRDVKPANILVDAQGRPFLVDFGLAKSTADFSMTTTGMVMGSPYFMSPEQAQGRTKEIDRRSDIYSLGAVLYQALTGRHPFEADDFGRLFDMIREERPRPPSERVKGLSKDLDAVILKCLEKKPERRYAHAFDLAADLKRVLVGQRVEAKGGAAKTTQHHGKSTTRIPKVAAPKSYGKAVAGGVAIVALLALIGVAIATTGKTPAPTATPLAARTVEPEPPPAPTAAPTATPTPRPTPTPEAGLEATETEVYRHLRDRRYGEAMARATAAVPRAPEDELALVSLRKRIESEARQAWLDAEDRAVRALMEGDAGRARAEYEEVLAHNLEPWTGKAREAIKRIAAPAPTRTPEPAPTPPPPAPTPSAAPTPDPAIALEAEAQAALKSLLEAEKRKDWKKCRELLAQRERWEASEAWRQAGTRLDEIAFASAEVSEEGYFAVRPRKAGSQLEWRYDFAQAAQVRDWAVRAPDVAWLNNVNVAHGLRLERESLVVRNAMARFLVDLEGELAISAEVAIVERGRGVAGFALGGYVFNFFDGQNATVSGPTGQFATQPLPEPATGRLAKVVFRVSRAQVLATVDDLVVFKGAPPAPPVPGYPELRAVLDTAVGLRRISLTGAPVQGALEAAKSRAALLGQVGRAFPLGGATLLCDGKSEGMLDKQEAGTWTVVEGALRGNSPDKGRHAELHALNQSWRNFRFRMRYRAHSGLFLDVGLRMGGGQINLQLPMDQPEKWREVEVIAAESAIQATVDGLPLAPEEQPATNEKGNLRIRLMGASASLKDVTIEEIRGVPTMEVSRKRDSRASVSGVVSMQEAGRWVRTPKLVEGVTLRADARIRIDHAGAVCWLETGSRFAMDGDRLDLLEGTGSVTMEVAGKFRLALGGHRVEPVTKQGRLVVVARPDRVLAEEGLAKWDDADLLEGVEYDLKSKKAEAQRTRSLPAALRPKETPTWRLEAALQKAKLLQGAAVELPGGRKGFKSVLYKMHEYFYGGVTYDGSTAGLVVKERLALRFRMQLKETNGLTLQIWDETQNKNLKLGIEAPPDTWVTMTIFLKDLGNPDAKIDRIAKVDDKLGEFSWLVGKPGIAAEVLLADVQLVEIER